MGFASRGFGDFGGLGCRVQGFGVYIGVLGIDGVGLGCRVQGLMSRTQVRVA